ncbi:MAG: hypothetical protein PHQ12_06250 [Chthoniobacteraceae bacterium]|nr:hypothetical protein [Chthoniobacteraceae bacterium]
MNTARFPRYEQFDPQVPVWCVTPNEPGCLHRFFDTSPISPSGRYLAVFQFPFEDRRPLPGEAGRVRVIDLETGENRAVAETCGWETQMGANINWGASDHELYFNDVDTGTWAPFAWKLDPLTGARQRMEGTVYHASPDGRWLISSNLAATGKTQPGYGVVVPREKVRTNVGAVDDDGFFLTDTATGKRRLLASIRDLLTRAQPPVAIGNPNRFEIYGFHSKFNPQGDRVMVSIRWFPVADHPQWDMFANGYDSVRYAWVTLKLDGSEMHCAAGPEQWEKGGHHATWFPDGKRISMNLDLDREGCLRFVQVNADGSGLGKITNQVQGSGHPTVHPDARHILADTYAHEPVAFGDGTVPLRWVDLSGGTEQTAVRINISQPCEDGALRVDPHPAWDRTWRYVTFNGFVGGTRRVFVADMSRLLK